MPPTHQIAYDHAGRSSRPAPTFGFSSDYSIVLATIAKVDKALAEMRSLPLTVTLDTHCTDAADVIALLEYARIDLAATLVRLRSHLS
ncbi:MAG: hypothetical protein ACRYGR_02315 [Janthinobacterium lividum]